MIDWDLAPEGATMIISSDKELRWANEDGQWGFDKVDGWKFLTGNPLKLSCWKAIATRPAQTKTVAGAVEFYNGEFPEGGDILGIAYSNNKVVPYYAGSPIADGTNSPESYIICTRAEFEAYVKEQEGEKWTHVVDDDEGQLTKCRKHLKLCNGSDWVYVCEKGEYFVPSKMGYCGVKPIKPTISESELLHKIKDMGKGVASNGHFGDTVRGWLDKYDIVEVPPND